MTRTSTRTSGRSLPWLGSTRHSRRLVWSCTTRTSNRSPHTGPSQPASNVLRSWASLLPLASALEPDARTRTPTAVVAPQLASQHGRRAAASRSSAGTADTCGRGCPLAPSPDSYMPKRKERYHTLRTLFPSHIFHVWHPLWKNENQKDSACGVRAPASCKSRRTHDALFASDR